MTCMSTNFDFSEDLNHIKCKKCGREYFGGYKELYDLNMKYIEENGKYIYIKEIIKEEVTKRI